MFERPKAGRSDRPDVDVIYHMFPNYRAPVMRALSGSSRYAFRFFGSHDPVAGIPAFSGDASVEVRPRRFRLWRGIGFLAGAERSALTSQARALILIGNPNFLSTWTAAVLARLSGKKVLFWAHGWLKPHTGVRRLLRNLYFGLAHAVLVYDDRARILATESGFPAKKVRPIYNSLDWDAAQRLYDELQVCSLEALRLSLNYPDDRPVAICTARLTSLCRFDLLLDAAALLAERGRAITVVLVGDGPERASLEAQAERLGIDVRFLGKIYDETILSRLLYAADVTVSPGKVGLSAMHSLTYGTPVITHDDRDAQMPEVEAVHPGETGRLFRRGDVTDLARVIVEQLDATQDRGAIRRASRAVMQARYTPVAQRQLIEAVLDDLLGGTV